MNASTKSDALSLLKRGINQTSGLSTAFSLLGVDKYLPGSSNNASSTIQKSNSGSSHQFAKKERVFTFEDALEAYLRMTAKSSYSILSAIKPIISSSSSPKFKEKEGDKVADDAVRGLRGQLTGHIQKTASGVDLRTVVDGVAAYVVVKVCRCLHFLR